MARLGPSRGGPTVKKGGQKACGKRQFIAMPFLPLIQSLPRDPRSLARILHPSMLEPGRKRRDMAPWFNEKSIGYGVGPRSWQGWLLVLPARSEEHTSELQSPCNLVCRLLLEKK